MTTNTGGAKLINDGLKEMGLLTPAQRYAKDHGWRMITVRPSTACRATCS